MHARSESIPVALVIFSVATRRREKKEQRLRAVASCVPPSSAMAAECPPVSPLLWFQQRLGEEKEERSARGTRTIRMCSSNARN
jgi:hypothetical protein